MAAGHADFSKGIMRCSKEKPLPVPDCMAFSDAFASLFLYTPTCILGTHTFSSFSVTGGGLSAVTAAAISAPMRKASARDLSAQRNIAI